MKIFLFIFCLFFSSVAAAVEYTSKDLRDPFSESVGDASAPGPSAAPLSLDGIIWSPKKPLALINGKLVGVGAMINGSEVVEIGRENVRISTNGQSFLLERKGKKI